MRRIPVCIPMRPSRCTGTTEHRPRPPLLSLNHPCFPEPLAAATRRTTTRTPPPLDLPVQLFTWLTDRDMTITPDGCFIGYKGVQNDEDRRSSRASRPRTRR